MPPDLNLPADTSYDQEDLVPATDSPDNVLVFLSCRLLQLLGTSNVPDYPDRSRLSVVYRPRRHCPSPGFPDDDVL